LLIGAFIPSEKYESVGMIFPVTLYGKKCSKPPTSYIQLSVSLRLVDVSPIFRLFHMLKKIGLWLEGGWIFFR
jgi:hypothetical protein